MRAPVITTLVCAALTACAASSAQAAKVVPGSAAARSNVPGLTSAQYANAWVERHGGRLTVAGKPFRFSGPNIEWLGLKNYGPLDSDTVPTGSWAYPSKYEIDDALATAHEMGATVVRAQTIGDTIGCPKCFEPALGKFNEEALRHLDLVVAEARRYGLKLWGEFDGDANSTHPNVGTDAQSHNWWCAWRKKAECGITFFTDPAIIGDYNRHMDALLNHVNTITGVAYKDDPTFTGFVDGNNLNLLNGVPPFLVEQWLRTVSDHFESVDKRHLFLDISLTGGDLNVTGSVLQIPNIDVYGQEYYPRTIPLAQGGTKIEGSALLMHEMAGRIARSGKAFAEIEYGWDRTNFLSIGALQQYLDGFVSDPDIVGEDFWDLTAHADGHGWQPVPADKKCVPTCELIGEDGQWWALYYPGLATLSNTAADMAQRAQMLRAVAYRRAGFAQVPPHEPVPAPVITSTTNGKVVFEGSAGSPKYSVQRYSRKRWRTVCDQCTTDAAGGWQAPADGCFRVIGANLDGVAGPASRAKGRHCPRRRRHHARAA